LKATFNPGAAPRLNRNELASGWFTEFLTEHESHRHRIKKTLVRTRTKYQNAILADSNSFGRCLILDGEMQSAQLDEFIYHESLVHPAMVLHKKPKDVLILGGGEGATVREILRHSSVNRVTMVDIDREVVDFCKKYLGEWHQGTLTHPKTRLVIDDARAYIAKGTEQYDIIYSDLPTPSGGGPVYGLYTVEFYRQVLNRLRPGGLFVAQAGSGSLIQLQFHSVLANTLRKIFQVVSPYYAFVPSFDVPWGYLLCSRKSDPMRLKAREVDRRLGTLHRHLRFYDGPTHVGLFNIPKYIRTHLAREKNYISERKPVKSFS